MAFNEDLGVALCAVALDDGASLGMGRIECPLARFAKSLQATASATPALSLQDAVSNLSQSLRQEEMLVVQQLEQHVVSRDKLRAELSRVEASIASLEARRKELGVDSTFCKLSLNGLVHHSSSKRAVAASAETPGAGNAPSNPPIAQQRVAPAVQQVASHTSTTMNVADALKELNVLLLMPDVRHSSVSSVLSRCLTLCLARAADPWTQAEAEESYKSIQVLVSYIPSVSPPSALDAVRLLSSLAKRTMSQPPSESPNMDDVLISEDTMRCLVKLLGSVNDDVKAEALECLTILSPEHVCQQLIARCGGVLPIVHIVATSTSEKVLEKALVCTWHLISTDESIRSVVHDNDGLRSVLDLLYTDSLNILSNVCVAIGYLTRDEDAKRSMGGIGGLEKLVSTLRHPSPQIQSKIAAAVWNCAAEESSRIELRRLGAIPALVELLKSSDNEVLENVTGALWNMTIDGESRTEALLFGGIPLLVSVLRSSNPKVVENASGTLWNCSSPAENRPAIRKAEGIPALLSVIRNASGATPKARENAAAAVRNCSIMDQNKIAIRNAGGIEVLLGVAQEAIARGSVSEVAPILEKCLAALWILTVTPESRQAIRSSNGLTTLSTLLTLDPSPPVLEKLLGVIRNCSSEKENRPLMLQIGVVSKVLRALHVQSPAVATDVNYESVSATLWSLSREDKVIPPQEGALKFLCSVIRNKALGEGVLEQAAGALSSLTMREENRAPVREHGLLPFLVDVLRSKRWKSGGAIINAMLILRNCTAGGDPVNVDVVLACVGHQTILSTIKERISLMKSSDIKMREESEGIAREASLCLKNCIINADVARDIDDQGAGVILRTLVDEGSGDTKKAASLALHAFQKMLGS